MRFYTEYEFEDELIFLGTSEKTQANRSEGLLDKVKKAIFG